MSKTDLPKAAVAKPVVVNNGNTKPKVSLAPVTALSKVAPMTTPIVEKAPTIAPVAAKAEAPSAAASAKAAAAKLIAAKVEAVKVEAAKPAVVANPVAAKSVAAKSVAAKPAVVKVATAAKPVAPPAVKPVAAKAPVTTAVKPAFNAPEFDTAAWFAAGLAAAKAASALQAKVLDHACAELASTLSTVEELAQQKSASDLVIVQSKAFRRSFESLTLHLTDLGNTARSTLKVG